MAIERAKNISLYDAGNDFKTGRSFHLGNLTTRDLFPVVSGCHGETFDLNTMSDRAYFPDKMIFQGKISDILLDKKTNYVASSTIIYPPKIGNDKNIQNLVDESFENSKTLGGFWMRINETLDIGEFTTFSKKIAENADFSTEVLEKINQRVDNESLQYLWSRYITQDGVLLNLDSMNGEFLVYKHDEGKKTTIHRNDLAQQSINFFNNRSLLSDSNINRDDVISQCKGPIFSNEMNAILIYMIDAKNNQSGKIFHVGGQAMYGYIKGGNFSNKFKQLLTLIDDDHDITNGIQMEGMEVLPAHFFRIAGYDEELLQSLSDLFDTLYDIDEINKKKGQLFKNLQDHSHPDIQALMSNVRSLKTTQEDIIKNIINHHEIQSLPSQTFRDGTLNELYQSQLDLYYQIKNGFNPKEKRMFLAKQPIEYVQKAVEKLFIF